MRCADHWRTCFFESLLLVISQMTSRFLLAQILSCKSICPSSPQYFDRWMRLCQTYLKVHSFLRVISSFPSLFARQSWLMFTRQAPQTISLLLHPPLLYKCPLQPRALIHCSCGLISQVVQLWLCWSLFLFPLHAVFAAQVSCVLLMPVESVWDEPC